MAKKLKKVLEATIDEIATEVEEVGSAPVNVTVPGTSRSFIVPTWALVAAVVVGVILVAVLLA